jgi:serine/threonine protein phosphatase PrpC
MTLATEEQLHKATPTLLALQGNNSEVIGKISATSEDSVAVAISRGGAKKRYSYTDPNEDVAGYALGARAVLLVVADGHHGRRAAEIAVSVVLDRADGIFEKLSQLPSEQQWPAVAKEAIAAAHAAILAHVAQGGGDRTRTTLAVAIVQPQDDLVAFVSVGDSHIFRVGTDEAVDLACQSKHDQFHAIPPRYLGDPSMDLEGLLTSSKIGTESLDGVSAIALATDGISEPGIGVDIPEFTIGECVSIAGRAKAELRPLELARGIAEAALAAHRDHRSGDNIATAVTFLPDSDTSSQAEPSVSE